MPLEIRPVEDTTHHLYEEDEQIGQIRWVGPVGSLGEDGWRIEEEAWEVDVWSLTGSGKTWGDSCTTLEAARRRAHEIYDDYQAERRRANQPVPGGVQVISSPMGGQKRR
ncbi:hypothetical protein ACFYO9_37425 [Streptomyces sp. NPDC005863]|uniref:hypothetical protein n=1 Tax=Streptomyces sp. NPDC005863 TaxID=3364735 RepID=UPI0036A94B05